MATAEERQQFIQEMLPAAQRVHELTGISAGGLIAQAAHETGWGVMSPVIYQRYHNPWALRTSKTGFPSETVPGNGEFVHYPDLATAAEDYARFVNPAYGNTRYTQAWAVRTNFAQYIAALSMAGYEDGNYKTVPGPYASSIMEIAQANNLFQFDQAPASPAPASPAGGPTARTTGPNPVAVIALVALFAGLVVAAGSALVEEAQS